MEINPEHPILTKMWDRFQKDKDDPVLDDSAHLLFGFGLLAEGGEMPEPVKFNRAIADLMARSL
jgi:HSP90 family molecular chaperone